MPKEAKKDNIEDDKPHVVARTATELQRMKLEKLMKNPEKIVNIPEPNKGKNSPSVPDFVRNVMGSSAGAGSGEFHVYRHLRRKEYSRQKHIQEKGEKEKLEDEYHQKLEDNKKAADEKTAKKRTKRLKKKQKAKNKSKKPKPDNAENKASSDSDSDSDKNETESRKM